MDHGDMDHGDMDMGGGNTTSTPMMMMYQYFHLSVTNYILFEKWMTTDWQNLLGSCFAVGLMGLIYESLKIFRNVFEWKYLFERDIKDNLCKCAEEKNSEATDSSAELFGIFKNQKVKLIGKKLCSRYHLVQTLLHFIQLWFSVFTMLVFMTFNFYLCLSVTIGGTIAYYLFANIHTRSLGNSQNDCH